MSDWDKLLHDLQALRGQIPNFASMDPQLTWTKGAVISKQFLLSRRAAALEKALELHEKEQKLLDIYRCRVSNQAAPISALPDEVLLIVFELLVYATKSPVSLLSVCHRWMGIVFGQTGSRLWSHIKIPGIFHQGKKEDITGAVSCIPKRCSASSSAQVKLPTPFLLSAKSLTSLDLSAHLDVLHELLDRIPQACPALLHLRVALSDGVLDPSRFDFSTLSELPLQSLSWDFLMVEEAEGIIATLPRPLELPHLLSLSVCCPVGCIPFFTNLHAKTLRSMMLRPVVKHRADAPNLLSASAARNPFPELKILHIDGCSRSQIYNLLYQHLPSLQHLVLSECISPLTRILLMITMFVANPRLETPPVLRNLCALFPRCFRDPNFGKLLPEYISALNTLLLTLKLHPSPSPRSTNPGPSLLERCSSNTNSDPIEASRPLLRLQIVVMRSAFDSQSSVGKTWEEHLERIWYQDEWKLFAGREVPAQGLAQSPLFPTFRGPGYPHPALFEPEYPE
ncbi:hypothetical protein DL93DRAFT_2168844 [Clavulina sp. PMI_390]|nr:hypothetical protein DL93DRAFT_2168844 [Clavulina sp. PMI_390]